MSDDDVSKPYDPDNDPLIQDLRLARDTNREGRARTRGAYTGAILGFLFALVTTRMPTDWTGDVRGERLITVFSDVIEQSLTFGALVLAFVVAVVASLIWEWWIGRVDRKRAGIVLNRGPWHRVRRPR